MTDVDPLLAISLLAAVPLRIMQLAAMDERTRNATVITWAAAAVEPIVSRGDALQYGGKRGAAADVFNHLARGLAALAWSPGGVLFADIHWCSGTHQAGVACSTTAGLTC